MKANFLKHIQTFVAVMLITLMGAVATSCSDDDKDEPSSGDLSKTVVGTWTQDGDDDILVINSNGTGAWYENSSDFTDNEIAATFTWTIKDGWMRFIEDGEVCVELRTESVSNNKIVWKRYDDYDAENHDDFGYYELWTWERYNK